MPWILENRSLVVEINKLQDGLRRAVEASRAKATGGMAAGQLQGEFRHGRV